MSRPTALCIILVVAFTFVISYGNSETVLGEPPAPAAPPKANDDLFKDKVLIVEMVPSESSDGSPVIISNARLTRIGSRDYLVGEGYVSEKGEEVWYDGMTIAVPSGNIARFESMTPERFKEYEKAIKEQTAN